MGVYFPMFCVRWPARKPQVERWVEAPYTICRLWYHRWRIWILGQVRGFRQIYATACARSGRRGCFQTVVAVFMFVGSCLHAEINIVDDLGRTLKLQYPSSRVVSLAPHLTEIMYAIEAQHSLIGVSNHCDYPRQATLLPKVSAYRFIDYESLDMLRPQLALIWKDAIDVKSLRKLDGMVEHVYVSAPRYLQDVAKTLLDIGVMTGRTERSKALADAFLRSVREAKREHAASKKKSVVYLLWSDPFISVSHTSWISQIIEICGGTNPFRAYSAPSVVLGNEVLAMTEWDVLIYSFAPEQTHLIQASNIVRAQRRMYIPADWVQRPSLRLQLAIGKICAFLHQR